LVGANRTADIFGQETFAAAQRQHMGPHFPLHFWPYPPQTLFLTQKLSSLPYLGGFVLWGLCVLFLMLYAAHMIEPFNPFPWLLLLALSSL
jgi:hypothetical protein